MFIKALRHKSAEKALAKKLAFVTEKEINKEPIKHIGVIVDADTLPICEELFGELKKIAEVTVLCYQKDAKAEPTSEHATFFEKDVGWKGKAKTDVLQTFLNTSFDLLISYYDTDLLPLTLASGLQVADFKVGIAGTNQEIHDMIIQTKKEEISTFIKELHTYLHILNKLS